MSTPSTSGATEIFKAYGSLFISADNVGPSTTQALAPAQQAATQSGQQAGNSYSQAFNAAALAAVGVVVAKAVVEFAQTNINSLARIERIAAQTDTSLKSTGASAWITRDHIDDLAGSLEAATSTEAEAITEGANMLLTFKNIQNVAGEGNDIYDQTVTSMVDMARFMGTDASAGAVQLGKALNDPIKGIAALTKSGITFSAEQEAMIESLVGSNDLMGAQKIILNELNAQFGGSGEAYRDTYAGQMDQLGHLWGTLGETIMTAALPALTSGVEMLLQLFTFLSENEPLLWTLVAVVGVGITAAFSAWAVSIWLANAALLANPATRIIMAIIVAVGLLVAGLAWATDGFTNWGAAGANAVNVLTAGVNGLIHALNGVARAIQYVLNLFGADIGGWGEIPIIEMQKIPGLADGGTVTRSGTTLVGERGPELLNLPTGSSVIPLDGDELGLGGGGPRISFHVSNPIAEPLSTTVRAASQLVGAGLGI